MIGHAPWWVALFGVIDLIGSLACLGYYTHLTWNREEDSDVQDHADVA